MIASPSYPGIIKIGRSKTPETRASNTFNPYEDFVLIGKAPTWNSVRDEQFLHVHFAAKRLKREFFLVSQEEVQAAFNRFIIPLFEKENQEHRKEVKKNVEVQSLEIQKSDDKRIVSIFTEMSAGRNPYAGTLLHQAMWIWLQWIYSTLGILDDLLPTMETLKSYIVSEQDEPILLHKKTLEDYMFGENFPKEKCVKGFISVIACQYKAVQWDALMKKNEKGITSLDEMIHERCKEQLSTKLWEKRKILSYKEYLDNRKRNLVLRRAEYGIQALKSKIVKQRLKNLKMECKSKTRLDSMQQNHRLTMMKEEHEHVLFMEEHMKKMKEIEEAIAVTQREERKKEHEHRMQMLILKQQQPRNSTTPLIVNVNGGTFTINNISELPVPSAIPHTIIP